MAESRPGRRRLQGRGLPLAAQVHRRPPDARACWSSAGSWSATGCRPCPAAAPSRSSTRPAHRYLDDPVVREEGGTPAIVESIRAGLVFALKQAVGTDLIQAREQRLAGAGRWTAGRANPNLEILGNPERAAAADRLVPHPPRRPLPAPRTSSSRCSTTCSASRPAAAAPAPARTGTGCSASTPTGRATLRERGRPRLPRASSPAGSGSASTTSSPTPSPTTWSRRSTCVGRHGHRLLGDYRFDPRTGHWRHHRRPRRPAPVAGRPARRPGPGPGPGRARTPWPASSDAARAMLAPPRAGPAAGRPSWLPPELEGLRDFSLPPLPA